MEQTDDWGGVLVAEPEKDDWGGVAAPQTDDWGGVEVPEEAAIETAPPSLIQGGELKYPDIPLPTESGPPAPESAMDTIGHVLKETFQAHSDTAEPLAPGKFSLPALKKAFQAYSNESVPESERLPEELRNEPIITLPARTDETIPGGISRGLSNLASGLTTPDNLAILAGTAGAGPMVQQAVALGFGAQMVKDSYEQLSHAPEGETPSEKAERITQGVASLVLGTVAGKHGVEGRPRTGGMKPGESRPPSLTQAEIDARIANRNVGATPQGATPILPEPLPNAATPAPLAEPVVTERAGTTGEALVTATAAPGSTRAVEPPATVLRPADALAPDSLAKTKYLESIGNGEKALTQEKFEQLDAYDKGMAVAQLRKSGADIPHYQAAEVGALGLRDEGYVKAGDAYVKQGGKVVPPEILKARELFPEQADVAAPKLDVKRSPFALGISPDNKAVTWLSKNVKRLFTATGDLPKETFESWIDRNGFVKAESRQIAYKTRDLYDALKDEFGISTREVLTKGFEKVPPAFVKEMNRALLGEADINTLPENVRAPLQAMRSHIDNLSQKMLSEGVVPDSLQGKVADNLGVYLTRSYRIFDDPVWAEKIPNDVRNRARDFIHSNLKKTDPTATPQTANAVMQSMLQDWKDQGSGALVKSGGKIGSKDLTSFIARKEIPQVLRELMGEYHDPSINYARSVTKMANLIGSQRFLTEVKAQGTGKFLFEDGKQPASHSSLIAAEGSDVMAPLNGLRTTPEIAAAFKEFGKADPVKNGLVRSYFVLSAAAKMSKTVGSAMTHARNTFGQAYFFAMNGHFDMRPAAGAVKAVLADIGAHDTPAGRAAYQRYLRLGIVDQSAKASELRDIIRDTGLNDPGTSLSEPGAILAKTAKKLTVDAAARAYQVADDLGKIIGFENELVRQREIHPEWSEATLEGVTAERIRNTYPTYSMVPEGVKKIRALPLAPFASFAAETFRTAYHNLRYTIEDLRSEIPARRKAGAQRLAGQIAVVGSGYALSAISQAMLGMNAQDEDDARRFMAPWDKDSQIMFTGKDQGQARYVNLSYVNPYSYLTDPVISVASGLRDDEALDEVMQRSFMKLIQPFTSEDILAAAAFDIFRNKTKTGARVFNPGDTPGKRLEDKLAHIYKAVEPGTLTRVKGKIIPAIKGETDRSGRKPELSNEILNELTGFKQQTIDYQQAVGFRAKAFKEADDDADTIFREVAGRRGTVKESDLTDAYKRATRSKFETWQSFYRDVEAARRRGVSDSAIKTAVEARGVSAKEAGAVMSGKFIPPQVSPSLEKQMKASDRTMPQAAENERRRAESLVLSGSF